MKDRNHIFWWIFIIIIAGIIIGCLSRRWGQLECYLFRIFLSIGSLFSYALVGIFLAGLFVIFDRFFFWLVYDLTAGRFYSIGAKEFTMGSEKPGVYAEFLRLAREFRATSEEGIYSDDIVDNARQEAVNKMLDGQEIDCGRAWLEFLGTIAPIIGFIGTLVGLIAAFHRLGESGELMAVLRALALAMTTSLLGALISVVFLSTAWLSGRLAQAVDAHIEKLIATAQELDRVQV